MIIVKKILLLLITLLSVLTLSACDFFFIEEDKEPITYNVNEFTRQELIDLVEDLMNDSYHRVDYDLDGFETALKTMVENRKDTLVGIQVYSGFDSGTASGMIYRKDGNHYYVVTNHHVIQPDNADSPFENVEIVYERNGMLYTIENQFTEIIGLDPTTDLAVIRFESTDNFQTVQFADSYELQPGQFVFALGNPLGFNFFGSWTQGVISGLARFVPGSPYQVPFLQHDAAISPGNSGGALFDINGELIGINNMKIIEDAAANIGFAIPSNTVKRIVNELEEKGYVERPFFGITAQDRIAACDQDYGVCVEDTSPDGTAHEAGIEPGDIITGFKLQAWTDYETVLNFNELRERILNAQVGSMVSVRYIRDGETFESPYVELLVHPDDR